jgi:hypothetical protein
MRWIWANAEAKASSRNNNFVKRLHPDPTLTTFSSTWIIRIFFEQFLQFLCRFLVELKPEQFGQVMEDVKLSTAFIW